MAFFSPAHLQLVSRTAWSPRYDRRNFANVPDPEWESEGTFGNGRDRCAAFPIKNAQITEAIERDATIFSIEDSV